MYTLVDTMSFGYGAPQFLGCMLVASAAVALITLRDPAEVSP